MAAGQRSLSWASLRQAVVWRGLREALAEVAEAAGRASLSVVDAGGGTGGFAVPLAEEGHRVLVVDPSPDSLASLAQRAAERGVADLVTGRQGDLATLDQLCPPGGADAVLCHNVLEVVDDPADGLAATAAATRPGGLVSVLAANKAAVVIGRALAGRFGEAAAALDDPAGRVGAQDTVAHRFERTELVAMLGEAGLAVTAVHGVRVFGDLVPGALLDGDPAASEALLALELAASLRSPYRDIATHLHVLARR